MCYLYHKFIGKYVALQAGMVSIQYLQLNLNCPDVILVASWLVQIRWVVTN